MKNRKENLFFEKFLVWKKSPEVPSSESESLEDARAQYFKLHEYLTSNYKALDKSISAKIEDSPEDEYLQSVKEMLDKVAFDEKFDPNNISKEDIELVRKSVLTGTLEFFHKELATLARGIIIENIGKILTKAGKAYSMETGGSVRVVGAVEVMESPQIETEYDRRTNSTRIIMTDPTTRKVIYNEMYKHPYPFPNKSRNLGFASSNEAGSIVKIAGVDVMATPAVEEIYDPKSNTLTLKFSNPLNGMGVKPFWVTKLEAE